MKNTLFVVLFSLVSTLAFAEDLPESVDKSSDKPANVEQPDSLPMAPVRRNRSEENRKDKTIIFTLQPIGFAVGSDLDTVFGVSIGYFINEKVIVSLDASNTSSPLASDYGSHDSINSVGTHAKYFFWRNFCGKAGVVYRNIQSYYRNYSSDPKNTTSATQTAFDFAIGHQWQFRHLTLGCDWVTYISPLSVHITSSAGRYDTQSSDVEIAKFYIGLSF